MKKPTPSHTESAGENPAPDEQKPPAEPPAPPPPTQAELDAQKEPLSREEALNLLRAGHRLRRKGDDSSHWIAMTRHGADLGLTIAATKEALDDALAHDLLVAE